MRFVFAVMVLVACERGNAGNAAVLTGEGFIEDGFAGDGCSYPVVLGDVAYAPSMASLEVVKRFLGGRRWRTSTKVTYRPTGREGAVSCGRSFARLPEIEITSLTTPPCPGGLRYLTTCARCDGGQCVQRATGCTRPCSQTQPCPSGSCTDDGTCSSLGCMVLLPLKIEQRSREEHTY